VRQSRIDNPVQQMDMHDEHETGASLSEFANTLTTANGVLGIASGENQAGGDTGIRVFPPGELQ
jgi:hypothetical protein